jgi:hypothetical protein
MILIDADSIVYACGFACERKMFHVDDRVFDDRGDAEGYADFIGLDPQEIMEFMFVQPESHARQMAKQTLDGILSDLKDTEFKVFLTQGGGFRARLATLAPYKGNRPNVKPVHYDEIRRYMVDQWGASVSTEIEADDAVAIESTMNPGAVIVSIDKDLDQLPGMHWNWRQKRMYEITYEEGNRMFYRQMLKGDAVDNIPGLYKLYGRKCTERVLSPLADVHSPKEMYQYVRGVYNKAAMEFEERGEVLNIPPVSTVLRELGRLLWLKRTPDDEWTPPCD